MKKAEHLVLRARLPVLRLRKNKALISKLSTTTLLTASFWLRPAWKRIVHWGMDFLNLHRYIYQNQLETLGLIPYQPRKKQPLLKLF